MAPVLKTGRAQALVGSNPTPSARISMVALRFYVADFNAESSGRFEHRFTGGARYAQGSKRSSNSGAEAQLWIIPTHPPGS